MLKKTTQKAVGEFYNFLSRFTRMVCQYEIHILHLWSGEISTVAGVGYVKFTLVISCKV